ncbi:MAG TPA: carboxypeptidase regulatory-like domain-containing protein [Gemmatimonadaceae bacterium]|nr:carboxypeptidase regulatory-like domain-containing protein [Gemmatimonadaceae bacterium]
MQATPTSTRAPRWLAATALACLALLPFRSALLAQNPVTPAAPAPATAGFFTLKGFVTDSIHNAPLSKALIVVEGTGRNAVTDGEGHYRIDSIPPGSHRVILMHPLLDTIGVQIQTPAYKMAASDSNELDLVIPGGERLASTLCSTSPMRVRGPGILIGFVRDPDTKEPAVGAKVSLVYDQTDFVGRKTQIVREAPVDSTGLYRICGLPQDMTGKVQVLRNGVSSGEVPIEAADGYVALRAFSIATQRQAVAMIKGDSGKVKEVAIGSAKVIGKVTDKNGRPLAGARVMLQGGGRPAITKPNGEFELDSLPSGTQSLEVRKLGYAAQEVPVELASNTVAHTSVTMNDYVQTLAAMRVEATADKELSDVGYLTRKKMGMGFYMDGKLVNKDALTFSDVMRAAPGLQVSPLGDGRTYVITDSRNPQNGCVNYFVDGFPWETISPGDIDDFVRPSEIVAVEVYHGSETPPQFVKAGQSSCATIVIWTVAKAHPASNNRKKP